MLDRRIYFISIFNTCLKDDETHIHSFLKTGIEIISSISGQSNQLKSNSSLRSSY